MTPRYPRLVSLLRAVDARQWIDADALEYLGTLVTWINATGDGPSVNGRALVLTESGRDVLELVGELDFQAELVRIAAELRSQIDRMRNSDYTENVTARACGDLDVLACMVEVTS